MPSKDTPLWRIAPHWLAVRFVLPLVIVRSQFPPSGQPWAGGPHVGSRLPGLAGQDMEAALQRQAVQDTVEGIAGLMQRFEKLQPQLSQIPQNELDRIVRDGQQLHTRFIAMQDDLRNAGANAANALPPQQEARLITFHQDLALFMERVEGLLGITGPGLPAMTTPSRGDFGRVGRGSAGLGSPQGFGSPPGAALPALGAFGGSAAPERPTGFDAPPPPQPIVLGQLGGSAGFQQASPSSTGAVTAVTDRRLSEIMQNIVSGMQRFEALHPRLRNLPQQTLAQIATRGEQLHQEFVSLQKRGVDLAGDGRRPALESDAATYAAQLEGFLSAQTAFVNEAEDMTRGTAGSGGGFGTGGGLPSATLPAASFSAASVPAASFGGAPNLAGATPSSIASLGSSAALGGGAPLGGIASTGGHVTPSTDQRLSAVIKKVVDLMQEFQQLRPQISSLPPQALGELGRWGQDLDERFRALQQLGSSIAGDGSRPMLEKDAQSYAADMESFCNDQRTYVEKAKQIIQSTPALPGTGGAAGAFGARPLGSYGGSLGSASVGSIR